MHSVQVLSCPPASCLPFGCPGHEFVIKGIQGCGVNTLSGAVGAQFALQFVVFNSAQPALSANVSRTIIVASPCSLGTWLQLPRLSASPCEAHANVAL